MANPAEVDRRSAIVQQLMERTLPWDGKSELQEPRKLANGGACFVICSENPDKRDVILNLNFPREDERVQAIAIPLAGWLGIREASRNGRVITLDQGSRQYLATALTKLQIPAGSVYGLCLGEGVERLGRIYPIPQRFHQRVIDGLNAGVIKTVQLGSSTIDPRTEEIQILNLWLTF